MKIGRSFGSLKVSKMDVTPSPNQKRLVDEDYDSPVRLHGVLEVETSVLVHRAVRLAREAMKPKFYS